MNSSVDSLLLVTILATVLCFLIFPLHVSVIPEDSILVATLESSTSVQISLSCALATCAPMFLDLILDSLFIREKPLAFILERILVLVGLSLPSLLYLLQKADTRSSGANLADGYVCAIFAQVVLLAGSYGSIMCISRSGVWTRNRMTVLLIFFGLGQLTGPFAELNALWNLISWVLGVLPSSFSCCCMAITCF